MSAFRFIHQSLKRKILFGFMGVFLLFLGIIALAEWQLIQIATLSAKSVPRSHQMKAMQDLVAATTELDVKLERFLIIRSASEHESLRLAIENLDGHLRQFINETHTKNGNPISTLQLHTKSKLLLSSLKQFLAHEPDSIKSRQINITMKKLFLLIEEISNLQKQWSQEALQVFKIEATTQRTIIYDMNRQFITLGVIALLIIITVSLIITKNIANPVQKLMKATREFASGKLDTRVIVNTIDEIGDLANIFNHMADQLQSLVQNQERRMQELKESSEALRISEDNLRITLHSIADAVIATDKDEKIVRMNPVAEKLTGWSNQEAVSHNLMDIFRIRDEITGEPIRNIAHKTLTVHETTSLPEYTILTSKNGQEYMIADSAAPIRSEDGSIVGLVLVFRDITEEHELQTRLHHRQKMDAIGQLAGGIAHDFNNMLGGIIGSTELLKLKLKKGKKVDHLLDMIVETAERAAELTGKLLAFARKQPRAYNPININIPLKDALTLIESTSDKRIKVHENLTEENLVVVGNTSQLQNAFLNLLINAVQAINEGGDIFITSGRVDINEEFCNASIFDITPGMYASIEIRDTGCGIEEELQKHIFEPFYTTKSNNQGTGLGLAAVLGTIQQHKGSITLYSEAGIGTCFHLLFPLTKEETTKMDLLARKHITGSGTILVVDDERVMRTTAAAMLESLGYKTIVADNGISGLELFKQNADQIDLVILDMIMPEMNGRDCFMEIRKIKPDMKVILASGFSREEELESMKEAGLKGFLHKPYRSTELSRIVHETITS